MCTCVHGVFPLLTLLVLERPLAVSVYVYFSSGKFSAPTANTSFLLFFLLFSLCGTFFR